MRLVSLLTTCRISSILSPMCKSLYSSIRISLALKKQSRCTITKILLSWIIGPATNAAQLRPQLVTTLLIKLSSIIKCKSILLSVLLLQKNSLVLCVLLLSGSSAIRSSRSSSVCSVHQVWSYYGGRECSRASSSARECRKQHVLLLSKYN